MKRTRTVGTPEGIAAVELADLFADRLLRPRVDAAERASAFPRDVFSELGKAGLLSLPYPESYGGGGQAYEVYLQVLESLAAAWASVAVGVSVHTLSCFGVFAFGTDEQRQSWLPAMLGGAQLGAYCLSEAHAGSDPSAMRTTARRDGEEYEITGTKAWITHGGAADFYFVMARTSEGRSGISSFVVPADAPGITFDQPESKMGLTGSLTASVVLDHVRVPSSSRIGDEGDGMRIALASLDAGRLGIAAIATGLAQSALDVAVGYARERETFGKPIIEHQGLAFMLADMSAAVETSRAMYLRAAGMRDANEPYGHLAAIAKLTASDNAMRVTTDAVQILGGAGYTRDFPVERLMREAKVMQIFEGTNQIQRMVIARAL